MRCYCTALPESEDGNVHTGTDAHGGAHRDLLHVDTLLTRGLHLIDLFHESLQVRRQTGGFERSTADRGVNDTGLIGTELNLTRLGVLHGLGDVRGHGTDLRVRHQAARPEDLAQLTHNAHRIRRGDHDVEVELTGLHFSSEVINMTFTIFLISLIRSCRGEKSAAVIQYEKAQALTSTYKGLPVCQLLAYINQNFNRIISLDDLTHFAHVSKTTLIDLFKELYGTTPIRYLNNLRMEKARELLANSDLSIGEISELVGFQSIHYFSRSFKEREGCTPLCYRKTHQDSRYITLNSRPV